jgi:prophage DNA circulation protein
MSGNVFGTIQGISNIASSGNNIASTTLSNLGFGQGASSYWMDRLRPASFRGIPFGVLGSEIRFGRRNVLHQYPLRDSVWVEDMGRSARRITMEGFLVGDDVIAQREKLIAACESPGDAKLVHPSLGELTVGVLNAESSEQWDHGRVFKIQFSFIEGGKRIFPSITASTGDIVANAATASDIAARASFGKRVAQALRNGAAAVQAAANTAALWARNVQRLINDATNIKHLFQDAKQLLNHTQGRRLNGGSSPASTGLTPQQITGAGSAARSNVNSASSALSTSANALSSTTTDAFAGAAQALIASALATSVNSSDGLRLMSSAAVFSPAILPASDVIGSSINTVTNASADMFRRAAVAAMARASATYQPLSYDDAANVRAWVTEMLDAEADIAGDQQEDDVMNALYDLRTAVTQDLTARGANLSRVVQMTTNSPVPSLVLAYRLYNDISRADQLVEFAHPVHPAFMPTSIRVLSA